MRAGSGLVYVLNFLCLACAAEAAGLSGVVYDSRGTPLYGAEIQVQSESSGARWRLTTDERGCYALPAVPPGEYRARARMPGFQTVSRIASLRSTTEDLRLDFALEIIALHEVITVVSDRDSLDPSGGDTLILARESAGSQPTTNGRDFRASFDLLPGVVITPAGVNDAGQFSSNGQRPNSSAFRVDGASANTGVGNGAWPGTFPGASLPAMTAFGTTENLITPENTQSVEFRPVSFAPESGGRPGSHTTIATRSGTNEFHGSAFARLRDHGWNARDWFYNSEPAVNSQSFYQGPLYRAKGGAVGGPVFANRTFFFVSADQSSLSSASHQRTSVPSMTLRRDAPPQLGGILDFFPYPTGRDLGNGESEGVIVISATGTLKTYSLRADHSLGSHTHLFGRYVHSRSSLGGSFNPGGSAEWRSLTIGLTAEHSGLIHELRFNHSNSMATGFQGTPRSPLFAAAGLLPGFRIEMSGPDSWSWVWERLPDPALTRALPPIESAMTVVGISVPGLGQFIDGFAGRARQRQWELAHSVSRQSGRHHLRAGIQAVRLDPSREIPINSIRGAASGLSSILEGSPMPITLAQIPQYSGRIYSISTFLQDTASVSESLNIVYGLRWELTPPTSGQAMIPTVSGVWTGSSWEKAYTTDVNRNAPWTMRWRQIAPRLGVAYRIPGASRVVLRAGTGAFLDTALGSSVNPINGAPFNSWRLSSSGTGIGTSAPPSPGQLPSANSPEVQHFLSGAYPALRLPASWQWRASVEREVRTAGLASLAYTGSVSRNLVGNHAYIEPETGVLKRMVTLTRNASSYHALQLRYSGMVTPALQASGSYTWSHSIDNGSQDSNVFLVGSGYGLDAARGSSSFDVRHALTMALSHQTSKRLPEALRNWTVSGIFRARTGFPIDVRTGEPAFGLNFVNSGRPDHIPGAPVWIKDPTIAGGRRMNAAAFHIPPPDREGSLGRNAITGNGLGQVDIRLRRDFHLFRGIAVQTEINVFNVANHPAFADPVPFLSSPWFGQSTSMQNLMLGSGGPNNGLPAAFLPGGPRSVELGFRLSF